MDRSFACRYGSTSIYDLLGRDPITEPLTPLEVALFGACLEEHVMYERKPFMEMGINAPEK